MMLDQSSWWRAGSELVCSCLVWNVFQKKRNGGKKVTVTKKSNSPRRNTSSWIRGLQNRSVRSNRRPPVAVYQTDLTGNRWKPVEFKSKFKIACVTGSDRFTGRFNWFTGRFNQFTGRHMRWVLMGRPIFSFSFLI